MGLVKLPDARSQWQHSHAMIPTPICFGGNTVRVFTTFCDEAGVGRVGYVDVLAQDPTQVVGISQQPVLDIGRPGSFDDNGVLACSVVRVDDSTLYMYYVGFELCHKIRYRLLTGLAISSDDGESFRRVKSTPVLERSPSEQFFRGGPFCIYREGLFKMWYVAGSDWVDINGKSMPVYDIRYAESLDGINWPSRGEVVMAIEKDDEHGFGRPYVTECEDGTFSMHYSIRRRSLGQYRMGVAFSDDGISWRREDENLNFDVSPGGHDSLAVMYAAPFQSSGQHFMFYNGNDFGRHGFAVARRV